MLTRSGLALAIAALVSAVCGWWWHYEELVIAAALMTVAIVAAVWSSRVGHRATIVRTITSPRVSRGEPVRAIYRATNASRRRSVSATIIDRCGDEVIGVPLPAIAGDDRTEVVGLIPTRRRGVFEVGPWAIERIDPLGLAFGRRASDSVAVVLVHPKVHALNGPYGAMHTIEDEAVIRRTASDPMSGFVSLREYVDGDDPRLIHWPTSARLGTLMLREHVELRRPEFTVVLDAAASAGTADDFEEMVDVAASIAVHARRSGVDVGLRTTSRQFPGALWPLTQDLQILDLLTPVQQAQQPHVLSLAEIFRSGLDHTAIMFVTGPTGPSSNFSHTDRMAVVRVGNGAVPAPGVMMAVTDAVEFAQRWRPWR